MQGFSYSQLYSALQVWPLKASTLYLASINRLIYLAELRVIIDLDLDIFDVNDQVALAPGAVVVPKPPGSQPLVFTAPIAQNATSATLTGAWGGTTGPYVVTFSDQEIQSVTLTNGATTATWALPMAAAVTINAVVNSQFVVERNLWLVYGPSASQDTQAICAPQATNYNVSPMIMNGTLQGVPPLAINPPAFML